MDADLSPGLEVLRPIGQGSMADVFLAREPHLKRLVAVKVLSPHLYSDLRPENGSSGRPRPPPESITPMSARFTGWEASPTARPSWCHPL